MLERLAWFALALVHATPAMAFFRPTMITKIYGMAAADPRFVLFQHRAALFLAVFVACLWAAADPASRRLAFVVVAISMVSFLALYVMQGSPRSLRTIALVDLIGLLPLAYAGWRAFFAR